MNRLVDEEANIQSENRGARILGHCLELYQASIVTADSKQKQAHRDSAMHRVIDAARSIVKEVE